MVEEGIMSKLQNNQRVICGDNVEELRTFPDECIDLTVTSPPYGKLRSYNGYSFDFEGLVNQLYRVTKKGGVVVWVVKDSTVNGNKSLTSFKQCIHFQESGFNVYDVMIYSKTSGGLPHKNRYRDSFEYMFIFTKGKPKTVNLIKDRENKYGGTSFGNTVREKDGTITKKKRGIVKKLGIRYNVWNYVVGKGHSTKDIIAHKHPAIFPESLVKDHIISWSNEGDLVLDPFAGSGTTLKMANELNRNSIGIEISPEYCEIIRQRIER